MIFVFFSLLPQFTNDELQELDCLVRLVTQSDLLEKIKPREVQNDFSKACFDNRGEFKIHNSRFKTKIRQDDQVRQCNFQIMLCINHFSRPASL